MLSKDEEAEFAKAYKDLVEAEQTAATLEAQLNSLEQKLDSFLAEHGKEENSWKETDASSEGALVDGKDGAGKAGGSEA